MAARFSALEETIFYYNDNKEALPILEDALAIGLLLYSIRHMQNMVRVLQYRKEVQDACKTNTDIATEFEALHKKYILPYLLTEFVIMATSCCFALARLKGYDVMPYPIVALEITSNKFFAQYYEPQIERLTQLIYI